MKADWKPIDTAPKDGKWIRVLCENGREDVQRWCDYSHIAEAPIPGEWDAENGEGTPTHWDYL